MVTKNSIKNLALTLGLASYLVMGVKDYDERVSPTLEPLRNRFKEVVASRYGEPDVYNFDGQLDDLVRVRNEFLSDNGIFFKLAAWTANKYGLCDMYDVGIRPPWCWGSAPKTKSLDVLMEDVRETGKTHRRSK